MPNENEQILLTDSFEKWRRSEAYKNGKKMLEQIPLNIEFYNGNQHAPATELTQHIPRVTLNIIEMIVDNKKSNILGTPVKLNYIADGNTDATDKFTKFAEYKMKEMGIPELDRKAVTDALVKGTAIYYFYWNEQKIGSMGKVKGSLCCQIIDVLDIAVADPTETDLQKQEWIIVRDRENVENVKKQCKNKKAREKIQADGHDSSYSNDIEQGDNKVTTFTEFFRKDGDVYFKKSTKDVEVYEAVCLNPRVNRKIIKKAIDELEDSNKSDDEIKIDNRDFAIENTFDNKTKKENINDFQKSQYKANLYPFDFLCLKPNDRSIYGRSEVTPLIPTQKTINYVYTMTALQIQNLAFGKWVVKQNSGIKSIPTTPGAVIVDKSPSGMTGVNAIQGQPLSGGILEYVSALIEITRTVTNSSEIITGDMLSRDLSGTAITQIQAQAQKPIDEMQKYFWRSKERIGKILEMFFKLFYENSYYSYQLKSEEVVNSDEYKQDLENHAFRESAITKGDYFTGEDYIDIDFNLLVEAGQGSQYSELMAMNMLNTLFVNGAINSMNSQQLELYINLYPDKAMPFKNDLMRMIKEMQQSELSQAQNMVVQMNNVIKQQQAQIQQLGGQLKYSVDYSKELERVSKSQISALENENASMKDFMKGYQTGGIASEKSSIPTA